MKLRSIPLLSNRNGYSDVSDPANDVASELRALGLTDSLGGLGWRLQQDDMPNRSEAVCRLLHVAFETVDLKREPKRRKASPSHRDMVKWRRKNPT